MQNQGGLPSFSDLVPASFDLVIYDTDGDILAAGVGLVSKGATLAEAVIYLLNQVAGEELGVFPCDLDSLFEVVESDDSGITLQCLVDTSGAAEKSASHRVLRDC